MREPVGLPCYGDEEMALPCWIVERNTLPSASSCPLQEIRQKWYGHRAAVLRSKSFSLLWKYELGCIARIMANRGAAREFARRAIADGVPDDPMRIGCLLRWRNAILMS